MGSKFEKIKLIDISRSLCDKLNIADLVLFEFGGEDLHVSFVCLLFLK